MQIGRDTAHRGFISVRSHFQSGVGACLICERSRAGDDANLARLVDVALHGKGKTACQCGEPHQRMLAGFERPKTASCRAQSSCTESLRNVSEDSSIMRSAACLVSQCRQQ